jgi:phosphoribosylformimino-5-aminoimidazole carboxamide ribotide isomerase
MDIIPAIDLKDGQCVRLRQGEFDQVTTYAEDPVAVARRWDAGGPARIHVVDLDGALLGEPKNRGAITGIVAAVKARVQVGGGIRDLATIDAYLGLGVDRVILGTAALENPQLVADACKKHPGRIVVGIDARGGKVAVRGWAETSGTTAVELSHRLADSGVAAIVYTDISRDGMLTGPNLEATGEMARESRIPIIASGGISELQDLRNLAQIPNVQATIVGKALYVGKFTLAEALAI